MAEFDTTRQALIAWGIPGGDILGPAEGPWSGGALVMTGDGYAIPLLPLPDQTWLAPNPNGHTWTDITADNPMTLLRAHHRAAAEQG